MAGPGRAARLVCGRRVKWLILALWLVVLAVAAPQAGKLMDAEKNDASAWLPSSAESTKVVEESRAFLPQNATAVVVYNRPGGLTSADRTAIGSDVARLKRLTTDGITGCPGPGPHVQQDDAAGGGPGAGTDQLRSQRLDHDQRRRETDPARRHVRPGRTARARHRTRRVAADTSDAFSGIDGTLLFSALGVVVVILLLTYRSLSLLLVVPVLVAWSAR